MGEVIQLRPKVEPEKPSCFVCRHALMGEAGTYCSLWQEEIFLESLAAQDCDDFERTSD